MKNLCPLQWQCRTNVTEVEAVIFWLVFQSEDLWTWNPQWDAKLFSVKVKVIFWGLPWLSESSSKADIAVQLQEWLRLRHLLFKFGLDAWTGWFVMNSIWCSHFLKCLFVILVTEWQLASFNWSEPLTWQGQVSGSDLRQLTKDKNFFVGWITGLKRFILEHIIPTSYSLHWRPGHFTSKLLYLFLNVWMVVPYQSESLHL